ncbi:type VI secretion system tube protein TssD [Hymenobacter terrenus]|uniref:type VI secretion system tube protein TssD n=1 Tax=Hymenobacter terrenus TaxID=1629124 RepID=UPI0009E606BE|nr:type VI secretion system tube protein TssD [Hymenobacter terrenus]
MASFYAELHVAGYGYPLRHCTYAFTQATDERGRVIAKVRQGHIDLVLDVPDDTLLEGWAAAPHKPLPGYILFRAADGTVLETLAWEAGHCVGYREEFDDGHLAGNEGAYLAFVIISAPKLTLTPGAPAAYVAPAPREHGTPPQQALTNNPFKLPTGPPLLPEVVVLAEETLLARLWQSMLRLLAGPAALTAGLLLTSTNRPSDPGYQPEWDFQNRHQPPTDKDKARLAYLENERATGGSLTGDEQAELLALLAKVKGMHVRSIADLDVAGPLYGNMVSLPAFYYISLSYTKRSKADTKVLRTKFDAVREKLMKDLAADPDKVVHLKQAGITDDDLKRMELGKPPLGWQVHHKLPLDDGGDNSVSNLLLIKGDPFHKALTNYQNAATFKMDPGDTRILK